MNRRARFGTGALALASVVALLPACSGTSVMGERARVGMNFDEHADSRAVETIARAGHRSYVELPTGRLRIGVDSPLPYLRVDDPKGGDDQVPLLTPRGGSFVRVAWDLDFVQGEVISDEDGRPDRPDTFDALNLVAGGTRYFLGSGDAGSRASTVWTVPGDGKDVRIEVTYDGVVQTLDPFTGTRRVGRAAPLYRAPAARRGDCALPQVAAPFAAVPTTVAREPAFACEYQVRRMAYVTGAGWAPAGKAWLVVDLDLVHPGELVLSRAGTQQAYSYRFDADLSARIGAMVGKSASGAFRHSDYGHTVIFAVPVGARLPATLPVRQVLVLIAVKDLDERDRVRQQLDLTWTVPLR